MPALQGARIQRDRAIILVAYSHGLRAMKKAAFLRFSQGAMRGEVAVWVVGAGWDERNLRLLALFRCRSNTQN